MPQPLLLYDCGMSVESKEKIAQLLKRKLDELKERDGDLSGKRRAGGWNPGHVGGFDRNPDRRSSVGGEAGDGPEFESQAAVSDFSGPDVSSPDAVAPGRFANRDAGSDAKRANPAGRAGPGDNARQTGQIPQFGEAFDPSRRLSGVAARSAVPFRTPEVEDPWAALDRWRTRYRGVDVRDILENTFGRGAAAPSTDSAGDGRPA